jgi:hypothetical protein
MILAQFKRDLLPTFFGFIPVRAYWPIYDGRVTFEGLIIAESTKPHIHNRLNRNVSPSVDMSSAWLIS